MSVETSRATLADAAEMAPRMRAADAAEVWQETHQAPHEALELALSLSGSEAWTVRVNGKIMAMWGVVMINLLAGTAVPWLLTTDEVDRHPLAFMRETRRAVRWLRTRHSVMINRIDVRYKRALRWACRAGFMVTGPEKIGTYEFYTITLRGV